MAGPVIRTSKEPAGEDSDGLLFLVGDGRAGSTQGHGSDRANEWHE